MKEAKLFVIPGSRHSEEAEKLLRDVGLPHKTIVLNNRDLLAAVSFDLGIQKAPALYVGGQYYQGLKNIKDFVHRNNK